MTQTVSILGCGWVGLPLAEALLSAGYAVKGSVRSKDKLPLLDRLNIIPFHLNLDPNSGFQLEPSSFFNSDILIITLPYKRSFSPPTLYLDQIQTIVPYLESSSIQRVFFTSSTSIYPQTSAIFREDSLITDFSERSHVLFDIERLLLSLNGPKTTICRLAGLYGYDRKLGHYLSGKTNLKGGNTTVNLIHRDDVIQIMMLLIKELSYYPIVNFVSDGHPKRKELYIKKSLLRGTPLPDFQDDDKIVKRIVSNKFLKTQLNYSFKYKDPIDD